LAAGVILFLYPKNPRRLLDLIVNDEGPEIAEATCITHGLASIVIFLDTLDQADGLQSRYGALLNGTETWCYANGQIRVDNVRTWKPQPGPCDHPRLCQIDVTMLPDPMVKEVTQFNLNVDVLASAVSSYAPEFSDLVVWLIDSATKRTDVIRHLCEQEDDYHKEASILVDLNSCLTMVISQLCAGSLPLLQSFYPVGQYSLLGIGTVARAAWSLYQHMAQVFARVDHVNQIAEALDRGLPFDPGFDFRNKSIDMTSWIRAAHQLSLNNDSAESCKPGRGHLIYFSSRWGFHETLNSISLSWQTITSGALPEWTLLTLSHEFLHSYFRETIHSTLFATESYGSIDHLVLRYNDVRRRHSSNPGAWRELDLSSADCMRFFFLNQLQICSQLDQWVTNALTNRESFEARIADLSPGEAEAVMTAFMPGDLEEYVVHILDFQYFYDAHARYYVSSIWNTWSLVPDVYRRVDHYVLRTLLALASVPGEQSSTSAFKSAHQAMVSELQELIHRRNNSLAQVALNLLHDDDGCGALFLRFSALYNLVVFTRVFFMDSKMYARLMSDPSQDRAADNRYGLSVGEFHEPVHSPIAFLLDRFAQALDGDQSNSEYASLWQFILMINERTTQRKEF